VRTKAAISSIQGGVLERGIGKRSSIVESDRREGRLSIIERGQPKVYVEKSLERGGERKRVETELDQRTVAEKQYKG